MTKRGARVGKHQQHTEILCSCFTFLDGLYFPPQEVIEISILICPWVALCTISQRCSHPGVVPGIVIFSFDFHYIQIHIPPNTASQDSYQQPVLHKLAMGRNACKPFGPRKATACLRPPTPAPGGTRVNSAPLVTAAQQITASSEGLPSPPV